MPYIFGQLNDKNAAEQICHKLANQGVLAKYSQVQDGSYALFVDEEKDVQLAHDFYRVSLGMPPRFELPPEALAMASVPRGQATLGLILVCVGVQILGWTSDINAVRAALMFSVPEMLEGEWWRLFTPAIVHFGLLHIVFNMLWLKSLGSIIEFTRGKVFFLSLVFASAIFSNILQFWFKGPLFGGMSGVVYALLGFLWMAKEFNPNEEFSLPKQDVMMMIGWFVLCLTGLMGPIANFAHAGGLAIGMAAGIGAGTYKHGQFEPLKTFKFSAAACAVLVVTWVTEVFLF